MRFLDLLPMYPFNCPATQREIDMVAVEWLPTVLENIPQVAVSTMYSVSKELTTFVMLQTMTSTFVILFNLYSPAWPAGLSCLGGPNISSYDLTNDRLYLRYIIAACRGWHCQSEPGDQGSQG